MRKSLPVYWITCSFILFVLIFIYPKEVFSAEPPNSIQNLLLTSMCSPEPEVYRVWRVRNSNSIDLEFTWTVYDSGQSGSGIALAHSDVFFNTTTVTGANTTVIFVNGIQHDVKASQPNACNPAPEPPTSTVTPMPIPTNTATNTPEQWDRSSISVTGTCLNHVPTFTVINGGDGNMAGATPWTLYENPHGNDNGTMVESGHVGPLASGDSATLSFPQHAGKTLRLVVQQRPYHPGHSQPRDEVSASCGQVPTNTPTETTLPSFTPTFTMTPSPSNTPTWTSTPTSTATLTLTPSATQLPSFQPLSGCFVRHWHRNGHTEWRIINPNPVPLIPGTDAKLLYNWAVYSQFNARGSILQQASGWDNPNPNPLNTVYARSLKLEWYLYNNGQVTDILGSIVINANGSSCCYPQPTPTFTSTPRPTNTPSFTPTFTSTPRPTNTPSFTPTFTSTPRPTNTPSFTPTFTSTPRPTNTPSFTPTFTNTPRPTNTPSFTPTFTSTPRPTNTPSFTPTPTSNCTYDVTSGNVYGSNGLIWAIEQANVDGINSLICLEPGDYILTTPYAGVTGLPIMVGQMQIEGNNATIRRSTSLTELRLIEVGSGAVIVINDLTLTGGNVPFGDGGALLNFNGTITLNNVVIDTNKAMNGGGIYNDLGSLTIYQSRIQNNNAETGGGIFSFGNISQVIIDNALIQNNDAVNGGGIFNSDGTINITNSYVMYNIGTNLAGGIYNNNSGQVSIYNSELSNNTSQAYGGAISTNGSSMIVNNSCITNNTAPVGSGITNLNLGLPPVNAINNWWGAADGPSGIGTGSGDAIYGNVTYLPFLTTKPIFCN